MESDSGPSFPVVIPTNLNGRAALGSEGDHLVGKRLAEPLQVEGALGYERLVHQFAYLSRRLGIVEGLGEGHLGV